MTAIVAVHIHPSPPVKRQILCESYDPQTAFDTPSHGRSSSRVVQDSTRSRPETFTLGYDRLVIAVGAQVNTFGVSGVKEHCHFLKVGLDAVPGPSYHVVVQELKDARRIRRAIGDAFESAATPGQSESEQRRLMTFVIVGGSFLSCNHA